MASKKKTKLTNDTLRAFLCDRFIHDTGRFHCLLNEKPELVYVRIAVFCGTCNISSYIPMNVK
jgi:hypothetical protein